MALMAPRELGASRNLFRIEIGDHVASLLRHQPRWHEIESARNPKPRPANNWPPQRSESDVTRSAALRVTHFSETPRVRDSGAVERLGAQLRRTALTGSAEAQAPAARLYHGPIGPNGAVSAAAPCSTALPCGASRSLARDSPSPAALAPPRTPWRRAATRAQSRTEPPIHLERPSRPEHDAGVLAPRELAASRNPFRIEVAEHVASLLRHQPRCHEVENSDRANRPRASKGRSPHCSEFTVMRSATLVGNAFE